MSLRSSSNDLTVGQLRILASGTFVLGVDGFVLAGLLPQISADLGVSVAQAGQLTTFFAIAYALASPIIAIAAGRWERRRLLLLGMAVFAVGMVIQAVAPSFGVMATGRVLAAVGAAAFQSNAYAVAGVLSTQQTRPRNLAAVALGTSVSLVAGLPFGVAIGSWLGWRAPIWVLLALALIVGALVITLPRAHVPAIAARQRLAVLRPGPVLRLLLSTVLVVTPVYTVLSFTPSVLHGTGAIVTVGLLVFGAGQVAATRSVAPLIRRNGSWRTFAWGAVATPVILAILSLTQGVPVLACVAMLLLGGVVGLVIVPQQNRLFDTAPDVAPIAMGFNGSAIYVGAAVGAVLGGLVLEQVGDVWIAPAAAIAGVVAVLACLVLAPERGKSAAAPMSQASVDA